MVWKTRLVLDNEARSEGNETGASMGRSIWCEVEDGLEAEEEGLA